MMQLATNGREDSAGVLLGCGLTLSSYYVLGFQELGRTTGLQVDLAAGMRARGFDELRERVGPTYAPSTLLVRYTAEGRSRFAVLDLSDSPDPAFKYSYRRDLLPHVDAYFKANLDRGALRQDSFLRQYDAKVFDLPFFFAVRPRIGRDLIRAASMRDNPVASAVGVVDTARTLRATIPLGFLERNRRRPKSRDYTFLVTYYTHRDHDHDNEFRLELIRKLREDRSLNGIAAFASSSRLPAPYSEYSANFVSLPELLRMYAGSRVAVYVRGLHGCLSFKLGQYLALGLPVVGQTITLDNRFARGIPAFSEQFNATTPDDIVRDVKHAARMPDEARDRTGSANLEYFKNTVSPAKAAEFVVTTIKSVREGTPVEPAVR